MIASGFSVTSDTVGQLPVLPAHDVIGPGHAVWSAWSLDPVAWLGIGAFALLYARGLRNWPERSRTHPRWRIALYYSGLATIWLSLVSPIDALGSHHFTMHMIQHVMIMLIGIPLAMLGAPTTPVLRGMPRWLRLGVVSGVAADPIARGFWRVLTHPLVALVLYTAVVWAWHFAPGWYDAAVQREPVHYLQHFSFAGAAFLFWWNVIDPAPLRARMGYLVRMAYVLAASTAQSAMSIFLAMSTRPFYEAYQTARPILPLSPLDDQQLGGMVMWVAPGQLLHVAALGLLFAVWWIQTERRQQEAEALADGPLIRERL